MNNQCPNCGTRFLAGAAACPVCGQPASHASARSSELSSPGAAGEKKNALTIFAIAVGLGALLIAATIGIYVYANRYASSGSSLERYVPQRLGKFERFRFRHPDWPIPEGATDTLGAGYSVGLQWIQLSLISFPSREQTTAYAQSRVKFYQDQGATIVQRMNMNRNGEPVGEKFVMTQDLGLPELGEAVIWNNESVVFVAIGHPADAVTEVASSLPF